MIKLFLAKIKASAFFSFLRRCKYKLKRKNKNSVFISLEEFEKILINDLGITSGDAIMVHCGFGFLKASFTPNDLIELLIKTVGPNGHIMMPFYPPGLSRDWACSENIFDPDKVKSSTGIVSQLFNNRSDTYVSCHPLKAVSVWGLNAEEIVAGHQKSSYPYDIDSPYYKFAKLKNSKSIGLGVKNCSTFHLAEDLYEDNKSYLYTKFQQRLKVQYKKESVIINTYYHHGKIKLMESLVFLGFRLPTLVKVFDLNNTSFYVVRNDELLKACKELFQKGFTRICH